MLDFAKRIFHCFGDLSNLSDRFFCLVKVQVLLVADAGDFVAFLGMPEACSGDHSRWMFA